jgi:glyoxylase-like metal-dependent hydrolase (beta-lactamase superfamily II)
MATPVHEIFPGIFVWSWFSERSGYDFHGTFVPSDGGNLCIDPVEPPAAVLDRLEHEGVARILLTNRNHTRAANRVRERTGARIGIHSADAAHARKEGTPIDDDLQVGARVGPFTVVGVPGKSPGEIALHDAERRLLVVGDAVIGNPPQQLSLLREAVMDDPPLLRASVRQLLELDVDVILTGDGVPIRQGAHQRLEDLVATFPNE